MGQLLKQGLSSSICFDGKQAFQDSMSFSLREVQKKNFFCRVLSVTTSHQTQNLKLISQTICIPIHPWIRIINELSNTILKTFLAICSPLKGTLHVFRLFPPPRPWRFGNINSAHRKWCWHIPHLIFPKLSTEVTRDPLIEKYTSRAAVTILGGGPDRISTGWKRSW